MQFRVIVVTDPQTHAARHRQDRLQYTAPLNLASSVINHMTITNYLGPICYYVPACLLIWAACSSFTGPILIYIAITYNTTTIGLCFSVTEARIIVDVSYNVIIIVFFYLVTLYKCSPDTAIILSYDGHDSPSRVPLINLRVFVRFSTC